MKYPKAAAALFLAALGFFAFAIWGENLRAVFLAAGLLCLLVAYVVNQRTLKRLKVDPFTNQYSDTVVVPLDKDDE